MLRSLSRHLNTSAVLHPTIATLLVPKTWSLRALVRGLRGTSSSQPRLPALARMPSGTQTLSGVLRLSQAFQAVSQRKCGTVMLQHRHGIVLCRKRNQELNKKVAKFKRGEPMHVKQVCFSWVNKAFLLLLQLATPLLQCLRNCLSQSFSADC